VPGELAITIGAKKGASRMEKQFSGESRERQRLPGEVSKMGS
jgi:hypothetical protein